MHDDSLLLSVNFMDNQPEELSEERRSSGSTFFATAPKIGRLRQKAGRSRDVSP